MNRKQVPHNRKPLGALPQKLVSIWEHVKCPALHAEARVLEDAGFDSNRAVAQFLQDRLELGIASSYASPSGEKSDPFWGMTTIVNEKDPQMLTLQVHITAEALWPLLVPSYTQAEKASVSLMLASTIVHELAVGVPANPLTSNKSTPSDKSLDAARNQLCNREFDQAPEATSERDRSDKGLRCSRPTSSRERRQGTRLARPGRTILGR